MKREKINIPYFKKKPQNILLITDYSTNNNNKCHKIFTHAIMPEQVPAGLNLFIYKGTLFYTLLTGAFLSIGFMTNFLSLKEMFLISLQGKPILGVSLQRKEFSLEAAKMCNLCPLSLNSILFPLSQIVIFTKHSTVQAYFGRQFFFFFTHYSIK